MVSILLKAVAVDVLSVVYWQWNSETSEITLSCAIQTERYLCSMIYCSQKQRVSCLLYANARQCQISWL